MKKSSTTISNEEKFLSLIKNSSEIVAIVDLNGTILYSSSPVERILGYHNLAGENAFEHIHPEDLPKVKAAFEEIQRNMGVPIQIEYRYKHGDGHWIYLESIGSNLTSNVNVNGIVINSQDITKKKQTELALRKSEERYRLLYEHNLTGVYRATLDGKILDCNKALANILGYNSVEEIQSCNAYNFYFSPIEREEFLNELNQKKNITNFELTLRHKNGNIVWALEKANLIEEKDTGLSYIQGILIDITEHKQIEKALKDSEQRFRLIAQVTSDAIYDWNVETNQVWHNEEYSNLFGQPIGNTFEWWCRHVHLEDRHNVLSSVQNIVNSKEPHWQGEYRFKREDGTYAVVIDNAYINYNTQGKPLRVIGNIVDVTERRLVEEALKASERKFRAIFNSTFQFMGLLSLDGTLLEVNQTALDFAQLNLSDVVGLPIWEVRCWATSPENQKILKEAIRKAAMGYFVRYELDIIGGNNQTATIDFSLKPVRDEFDQVVLLIPEGRDITERKQMEQERLKASKLDSLGVLAGGIAHDFNNLLAGILGNISLAKNYTGLDEKIVTRLKAAEQACTRAKGLTHQLLTFAKGGTPDLEVTTIQNLINESVQFSLYGSNVENKIFISSDLWPVEIDSNQISQVFQNLVLNSCDAMPNGGVLTVRAENHRISDINYIKISFTDNGLGISPEHLSKIFDPYFTTKDNGHGLGLAVAYSVIKKHKGKIMARSEVGVGTTFELILPAVYTNPVVQSSTTTLITQHSQDQPKILVMDDEVMLQDFMREVLEEIGYEVSTAKDGTEAIEKFHKAKTAGKPFSLVLLDLTIPGGMGGKETITKLIAIDKDIKAIVCSGYSSDLVMANYADYGFRAKLNKPFSFEELQKVLEEVLFSESKSNYRFSDK